MNAATRNLLTRANAAWRHARFEPEPVSAFHGTEADSTAPLVSQPALDSGWPTTRRFARTMYSDSAAFRQDSQYADPIDPLLRAKVADSWTRAQRWVLVVGAVGGIVIAAAGYL